MTTLACLLSLPPGELAISGPPSLVFIEEEDLFFAEFGNSCGERNIVLLMQVRPDPDIINDWDLVIKVYHRRSKSRYDLLTDSLVKLDFVSNRVLLNGINIMSIPDIQSIASVQLGLTYGPITFNRTFAPNYQYYTPMLPGPEPGWYARSTPDLKSAYIVNPTVGPFKTESAAKAASLIASTLKYPGYKLESQNSDTLVFRDFDKTLRSLYQCTVQNVEQGYPVNFRLVVTSQDAIFNLASGANKFENPALSPPIVSYGDYCEGFYQPNAPTTLPKARTDIVHPRDFGYEFYFNFGSTKKIPILDYAQSYNPDPDHLLYRDSHRISLDYPWKNNPYFTASSENNQNLAIDRGPVGAIPESIIIDSDGDVTSVDILVKGYKASVCIEMSWDSEVVTDPNGNVIYSRQSGSKEFCSQLPDVILPTTNPAQSVPNGIPGEWVFTLWDICYYSASNDPGSTGTSDPSKYTNWRDGINPQVGPPLPGTSSILRCYILRQVKVPGFENKEPPGLFLVNAADILFQLSAMGGLVLYLLAIKTGNQACSFRYTVKFIPS